MSSLMVLVVIRSSTEASEVKTTYVSLEAWWLAERLDNDESLVRGRWSRIIIPTQAGMTAYSRGGGGRGENRGWSK